MTTNRSGKPDPVDDGGEYVSVFAHQNIEKTETMSEKMGRRIMSSPLVPVCLLMTGGCLVTGLWAFRNGKQKLSNYMQRGRVFFQGMTVVAFLAGAFLEGDRPNFNPHPVKMKMPAPDQPTTPP